jgi:hypothetical protein
MRLSSPDGVAAAFTGMSSSMPARISVLGAPVASASRLSCVAEDKLQLFDSESHIKTHPAPSMT